MRARDVMSTPAATVTPERPVKDAAVLLASRGFTALPVVDCDGSLMVTVHDGTVSMADEFDDPTDRHAAAIRTEAVLGVTAVYMTAAERTAANGDSRSLGAEELCA